MDKHEELLAERWRPMYHEFRSMGLSEPEAFEATMGRDAAPMADMAPFDRMVESFRGLGMSPDAAVDAARGRDHRPVSVVRAKVNESVGYVSKPLTASLEDLVEGARTIRGRYPTASGDELAQLALVGALVGEGCVSVSAAGGVAESAVALARERRPAGSKVWGLVEAADRIAAARPKPKPKTTGKTKTAAGRSPELEKLIEADRRRVRALPDQ